MKRVLRSLGALALVGMALCLVSLPALAQKGGSGGGGGTGGGGGGGNSGGGTVVTTIPITMQNFGTLFNGVLPTGKLTFSYSKNLLTKSLDIQVADLNVPDGTVVKAQVLEALRVTGRCWHYEYHYYSMTVNGHKSSLSFSTSNGDVVPFLDPKKGYTQVSIYSDFTTGARVLDGLLPFKGRL